MNKNLLLVLCSLFLWTAPLSAQLGLKLGVYSTDINVSELQIDEPGLSDRLSLALNDANFGLQFGLQIRIPFNNGFVLQPELIFNSNTVEFGADDLDQPGLGEQIFEESYQYLDIPVLLGWAIGPLRFQGGPVGHVFLDSTSDLFDFQDYDQNFDDLTIGYQLGLGIDIWNLTLDLRREGNFTKFGNHIRFGNTDFEFNRAPSRWIFSVGYLFRDR